jgi:hypothetical protein
MRPIWKIVISSVVVLLEVALAQTSQRAAQSPKDPIQITSLNDGQFRFIKGSRRAVYSLRADIHGCTASIFDFSTGQKFGGSVRARVLDQVSTSRLTYVLMQVNTNTGCNVQGMCGAGVTTDLIWLKFDAKLKVIARASAMIADCATSTGITELNNKPAPSLEDQELKLEMRAGTFQVRYQDDDLKSKTTMVTTLRYAHKNPELGLQISSIKKQLKP